MSVQEVNIGDRGASASRANVGDEDAPPLTLFAIVAAIVRYRYLVLATPLLLASYVVVTTILRPRTFAASAAFVSASGSGASAGALPSIASQLGIGVGGDVSQSPAFFEALIRSPTILRAIVDSAVLVNVSGRTDSISLIDHYGVPGRTHAERRERAVKVLGTQVNVTPEPMTGIVRFTVLDGQPIVAKVVAERILELVDDFSSGRRRNQAGSEQQFTEGRVRAAREALEKSENELRSFLERNRLYQNDPRLVVQHERLTRAVGLRQQVYTSLSQRSEALTIDALRTTPTISVVEKPELPVLPARRRLVFRTLTAAALGAMLGIGMAVVPLLLQHMRTADPKGAATLTRQLQRLRGRSV